jgi:lipopolysaccharide export system protein LptA
MSIEKINHNINDFEKKNKLLLKILATALVIGSVISLMPIFLKYKTRILSSIIKTKNQNIKINKISIINDLKAVDISMMLFNKEFDISVKAENLEPEKESQNKSILKNITSKAISKSDNRKFSIDSLYGVVAQGEYIELYPDPILKDQDGNLATFSTFKIDLKSGIMSGKRIFINGLNDDFSYNLTGDNATYKSGIIELIGSIKIITENQKNEEKTTATCNKVIIDLNTKKAQLIDNVNIDNQLYSIHGNIVHLYLFDHQKHSNSSSLISSDISKAEIRGNVHLYDKTRKSTVKSENADYDSTTGKIIFTEKIKINEANKQITAHSAEYNINNQKFSINSKSSLLSTKSDTKQDNDGKIKIVFNKE